MARRMAQEGSCVRSPSCAARRPFSDARTTRPTPGHRSALRARRPRHPHRSSRPPPPTAARAARVISTAPAASSVSTAAAPRSRRACRRAPRSAYTSSSTRAPSRRPIATASSPPPVVSKPIGTAFGYNQDSGTTLLFTNEHVAEWPAVTPDARTVDGVPPGCKRVSESPKIVDNENDADEVLPWKVAARRAATSATRSRCAAFPFVRLPRPTSAR